MPQHLRNADLCMLIDNACPPDARARLEGVLAEAPQCAERLALWRRNDAALRFALADRPASPGDRRGREPPVVAAASPVRPDPAAPIEAPPALLRRARRPLSRDAAAALAATAGASGAGAIALLVLLLAAR